MIRRSLQGVTGFFDRFASSAVMMREASRTSRRWQTYASRVAFTGALFAVLLIGIYTAVNNPISDAADMGWMGKAIFIAISSALMLLALVLAPVITSSAIIEETEDRTLEMLVLSKLEPSQILVGKVLSRILILLTIVFGAMPVMAMVVTLGGVAPQAVVAVTIHTLLAVVISGSLGAFYGMFTKSPLLAMVASVAYTIPAFWLLPLGYVASTGHPNDSVHFSLFAGPIAQDWSSPVALFSYLPSLGLIFVIGTRLFELRIAGADIRKAFASETWSTKTWAIGLAVAFATGLALPAPIFGAYTLRYGSINHWAGGLGLVLCVGFIWAWWTLALTLTTWVLLRIGVDVVDALDAVLGGRHKRKKQRKNVKVWNNPVAWREARPAAWSANGGALLAIWLLGMLGMFQTGWWLIPGGSLLMGILNTSAAFGLTVWLAARSIEEERRNQSLELLLTSTVSSPKILLGKAMGVAAPTFPLLLLSLPFVAFGFPHLHMFDTFSTGAAPQISSLGWLMRGLGAWVWSIALWGVLLNGALLVGLRVRQRRSGFAVATGLFLAAIGIPGALGRIFETVPLIAHPCRLIAPPLAGGADTWHYAVSALAWASLALFLMVWTSVGLRRWISAGLGFLLAIGLASSTAQAQPVTLQDGFAIVAEPLADGIVRSDHWASVRVKIINQGRKAIGEVVLVERSGTDSTTYRRAVELPAGARKDVILLYRPNSSSRDRTVSLSTRSGRSAQAEFKISQVPAENITIGVLGTDLMGAQVLRNHTAERAPKTGFHGYTGNPRGVAVGLLEPGVLPSHSAGYAAFDQLVWPAADPSSLTPPQIRALDHWVADGGHLLLTVTENWKALKASPLQSMLPIDFSGTQDTVRHAPLLRALGAEDPPQGMIPMAVGEIRTVPGRRTFVRATTTDGTPAWVTGTYGLGSVSVLTVDPRNPLIKAAIKPEILWRRLLSFDPISAIQGWTATDLTDRQPLGHHLHLNHALRTGGHEPNSIFSGHNQFNSDTESALDDHERLQRVWLADIPGVAPLPMSWLLGFSGLYLFVIGPLDWFVLRLLHKQPWTWVTFPITVVVFSSVALIGTAWTKGDQAVVSTIEVVDVLPGTQLWRGDAAVGVFATGRTRIGLRAGAEDSVAQPLKVSGYVPDASISAGLGPGSFSYTADTWTMGYTALRWTDTAPGNVTLLTVDGRYQVRNDFPFSLKYAQITYQSGTHLQIWNIGDLPPGQTHEIDGLAGALNDTLLFDSPSLERGYLPVNGGQLMLLASVNERITAVEVSGVRPSRRDRTLLRVPLGVPHDPSETLGELRPWVPPATPPFRPPEEQLEIP